MGFEGGICSVTCRRVDLKDQLRGPVRQGWGVLKGGPIPESLRWRPGVVIARIRIRGQQSSLLG